MAPIARAAVRLTQRIKDRPFRNFTLHLIEEATKQPDLAHFTSATLKNPTHSSNSDPRPHATARLATEEQAAKNVSQTVHIYHDEAGNYNGHLLHVERPNKPSDG